MIISFNICDTHSYATEPKLKLIVQEMIDWYASFGQDKQFLHLYSA